MTNFLIFVICLIIYFIILNTILRIVTKILYEKRVGCFGINRFTKTIHMLTVFKISSKDFVKDAKKLLDSLEVGKRYKILTHTLIKEHIENNASKYSLEVYCDNKVKKRRILFEKIFLLNFKDFFEKVEFYEVYITKIKKE